MHGESTETVGGMEPPCTRMKRFVVRGEMEACAWEDETVREGETSMHKDEDACGKGRGEHLFVVRGEGDTCAWGNVSKAEK